MAEKTPQSIIQDAYRLYIEGATLADIAKKSNVSMTTLCKYKKKQNRSKLQQLRKRRTSTKLVSPRSLSKAMRNRHYETNSIEAEIT